MKDYFIKPHIFDAYLEKLSSWYKFSKVIHDLSEDDLKIAANVEIRSRNRPAMLRRILGRRNTLRKRREINELMQ